jgi:hypothetical protein
VWRPASASPSTFPRSSTIANVEQAASAAGIRLEALSRYSIRDRGDRGLVIGYGRMHETTIRPANTALSHVLRAGD